jgi:hypothetical protein
MERKEKNQYCGEIFGIYHAVIATLCALYCFFYADG